MSNNEVLNKMQDGLDEVLTLKDLKAATIAAGDEGADTGPSNPIQSVRK